jgi:hypothetical protein
MTSAVRDRTARSRIRSYLVEHGPIVDPGGGATALLKDAIDYAGTRAGFIRLVSAMEKDAEIEREIRGKRTYCISLHGAALRPVSQGQASPLVPLGAVAPGVDRDPLARALLQETWRFLSEGAGASESAGRDQVRPEQLAAERAEYAQRLHAARRQVRELLRENAEPGQSAQPGSQPAGGSAHTEPSSRKPGVPGTAEQAS